MVVRTEIFIDTDVLEAVSDQIDRLPKLVQGEIRRRTRSLKRRILAELRTEPPLPQLPFVWSLDPVRQVRARRWYFANKVPKGSKGGRYKRTGDLIKAWDISLTDITQEDVILDIVNKAPRSEYVVGPKQVPSHDRSGWPEADEVALKYSEIATDEFIDMWFTIADPFAGVPR